MTKNKIIIIGIAIILIISGIGFVIFINVNSPEPYFIKIHSDDDFEKYSFPGNGSINNPYIIEGYSITVPENYKDANGSPCTAKIIEIFHVSKSFIIQNNHLTSNVDCGNIAIILIWNVSTSFVIRNNVITGSVHKPTGLWLSGVNSSLSQIHNNLFTNCKGISLYNSYGLSIEYNIFRSCHIGMEIYDSINITIQNSFFELNLGTCDIDMMRSPSIKIINNTFINRPRITENSYHRYECISSYDSPNCVIINNSFSLGGVILSDNDYLTATIQNNLVNGKALGFFVNQTNFNIEIPHQYGQLKLINCNNSLIKNQNFCNLTLGIELVHCYNISCSYSNFSYIWTDGICLGSSNNISLSYNTFQYMLTGMHIRYSNTINVFNNSFYYNYNCISDFESSISSYNNSFQECGHMY